MVTDIHDPIVCAKCLKAWLVVTVDVHAVSMPLQPKSHLHPLIFKQHLSQHLSLVLNLSSDVANVKFPIGGAVANCAPVLYSLSMGRIPPALLGRATYKNNAIISGCSDSLKTIEQITIVDFSE